MSYFVNKTKNKFITMSCIVCKNESNKYKCPKCFKYYCSLNCYKIHKNSDDCEINEIKEIQKDVEVPITHFPFKTEDTVDINILKKLEQSNDLKKLLENPHLRNYLLEIDKAPNTWKAMKVAMQEPLFIEVADVCLKIVEAEEK